jgi:hypothetical protein
MAHPHHPPIFQTVPADEFTDREEIIGHLLWLAERTPADITISTSVVGRRRLGKTAVLEQVYNHLFWEQDAVVPIYFVFEARPMTSTAFAEIYFANYLRQYVAFRRKDGELARNAKLTWRDVLPLVHDLGEPLLRSEAEGMAHLLNDSRPSLHTILEGAIYLPRALMESHRIGAFMGEAAELSQFIMLDEFQEVMKIYYSDGTPADAVGLYQWAVEGRKCPHVITGSAIRLINQEVLGTGALFGRFDYLEFPPLEDLFALELVEKLARKRGLQIAEPVAGYLVTRCGGSPFYINCTLRQAVNQRLTAVPDEKAVDELLAHELTHGLIWRDWSGQLQKYFEQLNSHLIAKRVLFHAAQAGDAIIEPEVIAAEVKRPVDEVQRVLRQLAFADMIDTTGGYILRNVKDPLLREFIRVQYLLDVVHQPADQVLQELQGELARWKGKYADAVGELVEARIAALLHRFDGRRVPGRLFHTDGEVELLKFDLVYDTVVKEAGDRQRQIDLVGSRWHGAQETMWLVEIKHWRQRVDAGVVAEFAATCQAFSRSRKLPTERMVKWLVNAGGFTEGAIEAMREADVFYSGAAEINELLRGFGLSRLLSEATTGDAGRAERAPV